ncbi:ankyrin repeat domain-containing protein [Wolbachia pipientis]|uniref:ankyrin repeat domain-containing protein n=1 Tax=Wolbachia pipientis TaxID=955 RepID=UPI00202EA715|nr:ankyrin repeat domain-containing protein [Wolbachia pipientis]MCM1001937.1 ankyrin repeat domain-containing protein [Wolbachia pipientis]
MKQGKLAEILKEVNALPHLSADNIIEQIKTKLQEEDKETYEKWEKKDFHVNCPFAELITNNYGVTTQNTLLNIAVANNYLNVMNTVIERKANVNEAPCGWTPLHFAVLNNHIDIVDILIKNKANINAKSNGGWTPLLIAYKNGYMSIVKTLLEKEADRSDIQLLEQAEKKQLIKNAIVKGIIVGSIIAAVVAAALTFATTLPIPTMIGLVAGSALIASTVVGAGIYMMSKSKTEVGIDKDAEQVASGNMPKVSA